MWSSMFTFNSDFNLKAAVASKILTSQQAKILDLPGVRNLLRDKKITLDEARLWNYRQAVFANTWWNLTCEYAQKSKPLFTFSHLQYYLYQSDMYPKLCYPTIAKLFAEATIKRSQLVELTEYGTWILIRKIKKNEINDMNSNIRTISLEQRLNAHPITQDKQSYISERQKNIGIDLAPIFNSEVVSIELSSHLTDEELQKIAKWYENPNCSFEDLIINLETPDKKRSLSDESENTETPSKKRFKASSEDEMLDNSASGGCILS
jgi:hypothetical protein